jgi:hypothetical protein
MLSCLGKGIPSIILSVDNAIKTFDMNDCSELSVISLSGFSDGEMTWSCLQEAGRDG